MSLILSGSDGLSDVDGSAATPAIRGTDANTGIFFPAADTIAFAEGGAEAMRINSSGNLQTIGTISVGNATPSTSGAGITFPATQSASTNANTLDDYEEGSWTPTIGGTSTYNTQVGRYTKIGNVVIAEFYIALNGIGTGSTSDISGLPFSINASVQGSGVVSYFQTLAINVITLNSYGFNSTVFRFYGRDSSANFASGPLGIFGNGALVQGNIIYTV